MPSQPEITWNGNTQVMPRYPIKKPTMDIAGGDSAVTISQSGRSQIWATQGYTKKGVIGFSYILPSSYKSLKSMLSWIKQGRTFSYLSDSSLTKINTTVYSQISSTVLEVTDATGIVAAQELYMRTAGWLEEIGTVSSTTGATLAWTGRTSGTIRNLNTITYGASIFCAVGSLDATAPIILTSTDGITWTSRTNTLGDNANDVFYSSILSKFVAVATGNTQADAIATSTDGITWSNVAAAGGTGIYGIAENSTLLVWVGFVGQIFTSPDGITWTSRTSGVSTDINDIVYGNNLFCVVGASGVILTSPDGITWTSRTSGTANNLNLVIWSGTQFVAVGNTGTILTSPDGITWTSRTAPSTNSLTGITWTGRQYITVSSAGTYATSTDGITWAQTTLTGGHNAILSANNLLLIAGASGEIYTSPRPNQVTFTAALKNTYASGDIVRMEGYYPSVVMIPNSFKEGQKPGIGYHDFGFGIQEVV